MQLSNPIILKELLQAARHRRMFLARVALPVVAVALIWPEMLRNLQLAGQDWRTISQTVRPFFETCAWIELAAFSLLAFLYAMSAIRDEWSSRTMEVLCASPLSAAGIVYGKFAAVLSRVLLIGLALLPVIGILFHLARVPPEMALGCMAIILGSALFFGSAGLLQAILFGRRSAAPFAWFGLLAPFFLVVSFLDAYVFENAAWLEAVIPPFALSRVLNARPGSGIFALLSLGELSVLSLLCLAPAPWLFRRAFERHIGAGAPARWFPTFKRLLRTRRPAMGDRESPFYWQEKGSTTWLLRWALPISYGLTLPFLIMSFHHMGQAFEIASVVLALEGILVLFFVSTGYGATVFARDKKWGRAQALLLTGQKPWAFMGAKIRAAYRALIIPIIVVCATCIWMVSYHYSSNSEAPALTTMLIEMACLGPLAGVGIGMAFSLAARSSTSAVLGVLGSVLWGIVMVWMLGEWNQNPGLGTLAVSAAGAVGIMVSRLRRSVWALSALLALSFFIVLLSCACLEEWGRHGGWMNYGSNESEPYLICGSLVAWLLVAGWLRMGLRGFEAGMKEGVKA